MRKSTSGWMSAFLLSGSLGLFSGAISSAQATTPVQATAAPAQSGTASTAPRSRRRYTRRGAASRSGARTPAATTSGTPSTQVGPTAEQRRRDQLILAVQQQQSAETARQNAITTGNVQKERAAQQAEPRIQDAPGPGSQPLAGEPIAAPAQSDAAPRIQDAPGPAQTLPQTPPGPSTPPATPPSTQTAPPQ